MIFKKFDDNLKQVVKKTYWIKNAGIIFAATLIS